MSHYDEFRTLVEGATAEQKLGILRPEAKRILNKIRANGILIHSLVEERGTPQMPDEFREWCKDVVDGLEELADLIDALTDWKHRTILQQEDANRRRESNETSWKHEQAVLPELHQFETFTDAILQTARRLGRSLDESPTGAIKRRAFFHPGSFLELSSPERRALVGSQVGKSGRYVGYVVTLAWMVDKRNLEWREHEGLTRSLDDAVIVLNRWLAEQWTLEAIQQEHQWMIEGFVHRDLL